MKVFKKLLVGLSITMMIGTVSLGAEKKALLIGVGNYGDDSDWCKTKAGNDVLLMNRTVEKNGFHYTKSLTDQAATKTNVISTLKKFVDILDTGDVFLFYFSGHGQLVKDQNADEYDRFDESLVLYGAPKYYSSSYGMENHLLDEELSNLLNDIQNKLGEEGELMVLIDAGFGHNNEAVTKGISRGDSDPYSDDLKNLKLKKAINGIIDDVPYDKPNENRAPLVEIVAVNALGGAVDYHENGLFTFAVAQSFDKITDSTSYQDFYESINEVCSLIDENQRPLVKGNLDRNVFKHVKSLSYLDTNVTRGNSVMTEEEAVQIEDLIIRTKEEGTKDKKRPNSKKVEFENIKMANN